MTNVQNVGGRGETGYFLKLHYPDQYTYDATSGYISLNAEVGTNQALAVAYSTAGGSNYGETAVSDTTQTLILKLLAPRNLQPGYQPAWNLQMKNIFSLGGKDLKQAGFDLNVYYKPVGGSEINTLLGVTLLELMGLDKYSTDNSPKPDGKFDFISGLTVDMARAEIIFPTLQPFSFDFAKKDPVFIQNHPNFVIPDSLTFNDVYDTTWQAAQMNATKDVYYMRVTSSTAQSNHFSLGGFNIVEGSVQVLLNGSPLQPNVDYTVDYIIGEVVVRNAQALVPGANLQVKYEQNDLFQIASKTQMGVRAEMSLSQNTNFGFTLMNLNQATLSDKVRLGEEPTNNTILGVDAGTSADLPFVTDALDAIPFLHAREMSTFRINGEAAYILPNANTTTSTIASDNGASIAYIDDFEGALRSIPLGLSYTQWKMASPPLDTLSTTGDPDSTKTYSKAKLMWYNNSQTIDPVTDREIWPYKQSRPVGQDFVTTMVLNFDPNRRGMYNYSPNLDSTLHRESIGGKSGRFNDAFARRRNWNGVMRYISTTAGDLVAQNIDYLEIWMKATGSDVRQGRLYVDVGRISEDAIPNKKLNSEDIIVTSDNPSGIPTGVLHAGQDLGLDMLSDDQERADPAISSFMARNENDPDVDVNDPSGDDFNYSTGGSDFTHINGTEGNGPGSLGGKNGLDGQYPDTEDLNGDGEVTLENNYLEYEIPLDPDSNSYIAGGGYNQWYQFLIPLQKPSRILPAQSAQTTSSILQNVQYVRLWLSGVAEIDTVRIADINLVGNQWLPIVQTDSVMKVSVVSIEDNSGAPDYYTSPPGVIRERDKTQPDLQLYGNEQALNLKFNGLADSTERQAAKYFTVAPLDVFNYTEMKMFVHRDPSKFQYKGPNDYDAEVFLRFGADTLNFYEYRMPLGSDPNESPDHWSQMDVVFSELTSIKSARDANAARDSLAKLLYHHPGTPYGVKGNPSLTQIRYIGLGLYKPKGIGHKQSLTGDVWYNELRVIGVDNSKGYAYHFDTQLKLSDLGQMAFNYSKVDPNFHGIDQRVGDRITHINWAMNTTFSLERFFPQDWQGTMLSFGYSHQEAITKPRYLPSTDILVDAAAARAAEEAPLGTSAAAAANAVVTSSQSLHTQDSYSLPGVHFSFPWQVWYVRDILSKLSYNFTFTKSNDRDPSTIFRNNWAWNMGTSYAVGLPTEYYIQPFRSLFNKLLFLDEFKDWKFYYVPLTNLSASLTAQRSRATALSNAPDAIIQDSRTFAANKTAGFGWKLTEGGFLNLSGDYGLTISRDLLFLDNDSLGRGFSSILHDIFLGGRDGHYAQHFSINTKPKLPNVLDIPRYFDINANYSVNYSWQNAFQGGDIGKSAGWDNNIAVGSSLRLKALTDPLFQITEEPSPPENAQITRRRPPERKPADTTAAAKQDTTKRARQDTTKLARQDSVLERPTLKGKDILLQIRKIAKLFVKIPLLDYENITISFSQANHSANSGLIGTTGFENFWGRVPGQGSLLENGPSLLYQLGLTTDPSGKSVFGFSQLHSQGIDQGLRAANATLTDQFSQNNSVALKTSRPLWDGATLEINWKVGWQFSKSTTLTTDSNGVAHPSLSTWSGSVDRSFLTIPPVFLFKAFNNSLEEVGKRYETNKLTQPDNVALSNAFENGLEAFPILSKFFGEFVPRANWTLRWDGLEKIGGLSSVVQRMSLEHAYSSDFRRDFRGAVDGSEETDVERLQYGFSPLIGLNTTFKELFKGNLSGTFRYNTTTTYDLNLSASNIVETDAQEISLSLSYSHRGFNLPLFGINLQNDIDLAMTYSRTRNARSMHESDLLTSNPDGTPLDGNTRTTLEPRVNYALSSRVRASVFYRFTSMEPDQAGSTIPGTTTNEAGLDVHIAIQ